MVEYPVLSEGDSQQLEVFKATLKTKTIAQLKSDLQLFVGQPDTIDADTIDSSFNMLMAKALQNEINARTAVPTPSAERVIKTVEVAQKKGLEKAVLSQNPVMLVTTLSGDQRGISIMVEAGGQRLLINAGGAAEEMLGYAAFTHAPTSYLTEEKLNADLAELDIQMEAKKTEFAARATPVEKKDVLRKEIVAINDARKNIRTRITAVKRGLESVTDVVITNVDNSTTANLAKIEAHNPRVNVFVNRDSVAANISAIQKRKTGIAEAVDEFNSSGGLFKDIVDGVTVESMKSPVEGFKIHMVEVGRGAFGTVVENVETGGKIAYIPLAERGKEEAVRKLLTGFGELNAIYIHAPTASMQLAVNSDTGYKAYYGNKLLMDDIGRIIAEEYKYKETAGQRALQGIEFLGVDDNLLAADQAKILEEMLNEGAAREPVRVWLASPLRGQINPIFARHGRDMMVSRQVALTNDTISTMVRQMATRRSAEDVEELVDAADEADQQVILRQQDDIRTAYGEMEDQTLREMAQERPRISSFEEQFPGMSMDDDVPFEAFRRDEWIRKNLDRVAIKKGGDWTAIKRNFGLDPATGSSSLNKVTDWRKVAKKTLGRTIGTEEQLIDILTSRRDPRGAQKVFDALLDAQYIDVPRGAKGEPMSNIAARFELMKMHDSETITQATVETKIIDGMRDVATRFKLADPERIKNVYMAHAAKLLEPYDNRILASVSTQSAYSSRDTRIAIGDRVAYVKKLVDQHNQANVKARSIMNKARTEFGADIDRLLSNKNNMEEFVAAMVDKGVTRDRAGNMWTQFRAANARILAEVDIREMLELTDKRLLDAHYAYNVPGKVKKGKVAKAPIAWDAMKARISNSLLGDEKRVLAGLKGNAELYGNAIDQLAVVVSGARMFQDLHEKTNNMVKVQALLEEINKRISAGKTVGPDFDRLVSEYRNAVMTLHSTSFLLFDAPKVRMDYGTEKAMLAAAVRVDLQKLMSSPEVRGAGGVINPEFADVLKRIEEMDGRVINIRNSEIRLAGDLKDTLASYVRTEVRLFAHELNRVKGSPEEYSKVLAKAVEFVQGRSGLLAKETQPDIVSAMPSMDRLGELVEAVDPAVKPHAKKIIDTVTGMFGTASKIVPIVTNPDNKYMVRNDVREAFTKELVDMAERRGDLLYKLDKIMSALERIPSRIWGIQRNGVVPGAGAGTHAADEVLALKYDELYDEKRMVQLSRAKDVMLASLGDISKEIEDVGYSWAKIMATNPMRYTGSVEALGNLNRLLNIPGYLVRDMDIMHTDMSAAVLEKARVLELYNQVREIVDKIKLGGGITPTEYRTVTDALNKAIPLADRRVFTERILPRVEELIFVNEPAIVAEQMAEHAKSIYNAFAYRMSELSNRIEGARSTIGRVISYVVKGMTQFPVQGIERERFSHDIDRVNKRSFLLVVNPQQGIDKYLLPSGWNQGFGEHGPAMHMDLVRKYGVGYTKGDTQSAFMFPMRDELGELVYKVNVSYNVGIDQAEKILEAAEVAASRAAIKKITVEVPTPVFTGAVFDEARHPILARRLRRISTTLTPGIEGAGGQFGIMTQDGVQILKQFPTVISSWNIRRDEISKEALKPIPGVPDYVRMPNELIHEVYDFMGTAVSQAGTKEQYMEYTLEAGKVRKEADLDRVTKAFVRAHGKQSEDIDRMLNRGDEIFYKSMVSKTTRGTRDVVAPRIPMLLYVDKVGNIRISRLQTDAETQMVLALGDGILPTDAQFSVIIDQAADGAYEIRNPRGTMPKELSHEIIYHKVSSVVNAMTNGLQEMAVSEAEAKQAAARADMDRRFAGPLTHQWTAQDAYTGDYIQKKEAISREELNTLRSEENAIMIKHTEALEKATLEQPGKRELLEKESIDRREADIKALYKKYIDYNEKFVKIARIKQEYLGVAGKDLYSTGLPVAELVDGKITVLEKALGTGGVTIRIKGLPKPEFSAELISAEIEMLIEQKKLYPTLAPAIQERIAELRAYRPVAASASNEITIMPGSLPTLNKLMHKMLSQRAFRLMQQISENDSADQKLVLERLQHFAAEARTNVFDSQKMANMQRFLSGTLRESAFMSAHMPQLVEERDKLLALQRMTAAQKKTLRGLESTIAAHKEFVYMRRWAVRELDALSKVAVEDIDAVSSGNVIRSVHKEYVKVANTPYARALSDALPQARDFIDNVLGVDRDYVGLFEKLEDMRENAEMVKNERDMLVMQRTQMVGSAIKRDIDAAVKQREYFQGAISDFETQFWDGPVRRGEDRVVNAASLKRHLRSGRMFRQDQVEEVKQVFQEAATILDRDAAASEMTELLNNFEGINNRNVFDRSVQYGINEARDGALQAEQQLERLSKVTIVSEDAEEAVKLQARAEELSSRLAIMHENIGVLNAKVEELPNIVKSTHGRYAVLGLRPQVKLQNINSELKIRQKVLKDPLTSADDKQIAEKAIAALQKEREGITEFINRHAKEVKTLRKQIEQQSEQFGSREKFSVPYITGQIVDYRTKAATLRTELNAAKAAGRAVSVEHVDLIMKYESTAKMLQDSLRSKDLLYKQLTALYAEEQATRADMLKLTTIAPEYRKIGVWANEYRKVAGKLSEQRSGINQIEKVLAANDKLWFFKSLFMDVDDVRKMFNKAIGLAVGDQTPLVHEIRQRNIDRGLARAVNTLAQNRVAMIMGLMDGYLSSQNGLGFGNHAGTEDRFIFKGIKHREKMLAAVKEMKSNPVEMIKTLSNFSDFYVDLFDDDMVKEVFGEMERRKLNVKRGTQDITGGLLKIEKMFNPATKTDESARVIALNEVYRNALRRALIRHLEKEGVRDLSTVEADTLVDRALDMFMGYQESFSEMVMGRAKLARILDRSMDKPIALRQLKAAESQEHQLATNITKLKKEFETVDKLINGDITPGKVPVFGLKDKLFDAIKRKMPDYGVKDEAIMSRMVNNLEYITKDAELLALRDEINIKTGDLVRLRGILNDNMAAYNDVKRRRVGLEELVRGKTSANAIIEDSWYDVSLFDMKAYALMLERESKVLAAVDDEMSIFMAGQTGPNKVFNIWRMAQNNLHVSSSNFERRIYNGILGQIFAETGLHTGISATERADMAESLADIMRNKFGIVIDEMYQIPGVGRGVGVYNKLVQIAMMDNVFISQLSKAMRDVNIKVNGVAVDIANIVGRFAEERFRGAEVDPLIKDLKSGVKSIAKQLMRGEVHVPYMDVEFALSEEDRARARALVAREVRGQLSAKEKKELSTLLTSWGDSRPTVIPALIPGVSEPEAIYKLMLLDDGRIVVVRDLFALSGTEKVKGVQVRAPLNTDWVEQHLTDAVERKSANQWWGEATERQFERKIVRVLRDLPAEVNKISYTDMLQAERRVQILKTLPEASVDDAAAMLLELILTKGTAKVQVARGEIQALGIGGIATKYRAVLTEFNIDPYYIRGELGDLPTINRILNILGAYKVENYNTILDMKEFAWHKEYLNAFVAIRSKIAAADKEVSAYSGDILAKIRYHHAVPIGANFKEIATFIAAELANKKPVSWGSEYRRLRGVADQSTALEGKVSRLEQEIAAVKNAIEDAKNGIRHIFDPRTNTFIPIPAAIPRGKELLKGDYPPVDLEKYVKQVSEELDAANIFLDLGPRPEEYARGSKWNRKVMSASWIDKFEGAIVAEKAKTSARRDELLGRMKSKGADDIAAWLTTNLGTDITSDTLFLNNVQYYLDAQRSRLAAETDPGMIGELKAHIQSIEAKDGLLELTVEREAVIVKLEELDRIEKSENVKDMRYWKWMFDEYLYDPNVMQVMADRPYPLDVHKSGEKLAELETTLQDTLKELEAVNNRAVLKRPVDTVVPPNEYVDLGVIQAKLMQRIRAEETQIKALARPFKISLNRAHALIDDATLAEFFKANTEYKNTLTELAALVNRAELTKAAPSTYAQKLGELVTKLDNITSMHMNANKINSAYDNMGEIYSVDMNIEEVLASWWKRNSNMLPKDLQRIINETVVPMDPKKVEQYKIDLTNAKILVQQAEDEVRALESMRGASMEEIRSHIRVVEAKRKEEIAQTRVTLSERRAYDRAGSVFAEIDKWILNMTKAGKQDTVPVQMVVASFKDTMDRRLFAIRNMRDQLVAALAELNKDAVKGGFLQKDIVEYVKIFDNPESYTDAVLNEMLAALDEWANTRVRVKPTVNVVKEAMFQSRMSSRAYIETLQRAVMVLTDQSIPEEDAFVKYASKTFDGTFRNHIALGHVPPLLQYPVAGEENLRMMRSFARDYPTTQASLYKYREWYQNLLNSITKSGGREYNNAELQAIVNRVGELEALQWGTGITTQDRNFFEKVETYLNSKRWNRVDPNKLQSLLKQAASSGKLNQQEMDAWRKVTRAANKAPGLADAEKGELANLRGILQQQLKLAGYRLGMLRDFADIKAMRVAGAAGAYMVDTQHSHELKNMAMLNGQLLEIAREYEMQAKGVIPTGIPGRLAKEIEKTHTAPDGTVFMRSGELVEELARAIGIRSLVATQDSQTGIITFKAADDAKLDTTSVTPSRMKIVDQVLDQVAGIKKAVKRDMRELVFTTVHSVDPGLAYSDMVAFHHKTILATSEQFATAEERQAFITAANIYGAYFRDALKLGSVIEKHDAVRDLWDKVDVASKVGFKSVGTPGRGFEDLSELSGKIIVGSMKAMDRIQELFRGLDMFLGNVNGVGAVIGRDVQMRSNSALATFMRQAVRIGRDAVQLQGAASILKASYRHILDGVAYSTKDIVGQQVSRMFGGHVLATFTGLKNILHHMSYYSYSFGGQITDRHMRMLADDLANTLPWDPEGKNANKWLQYVTGASTSWAEGKYGVRGNTLVTNLLKSLDKSADDMSRMIAQGVVPQTAAARGYRQIDVAFKNLKQGEESLIGDAGYEGTNSMLSYSYADNVQLISKLEYIAINDSRTCRYCRASDGMLYNVDDPKPSLPRHNNCRCTYRAWFKSPNEIIPGTDVTAETPPVRLKRWLDVSDQDLGGTGASLNKLKPVKDTGNMNDEDWLRWFDEQNYPVRELMIGKDHTLAHALGAFDDEDRFDKSRTVSATARDIISAAYSDMIRHSSIELAKNFAGHHEVFPQLALAVLDRKNAVGHIKNIPFRRLLLEPDGMIQKSLSGGFNKMLGDVAGPGGALFTLANKYIPPAVMKMVIETGADLWNDINKFLPKHIADRLTVKEKDNLAGSITSLLNKDTPYPKLTNAYAKMMGFGDTFGKDVHEKVVGNWFGSMEALGDALINTVMEIKYPTGAGSPAKAEALNAAAQEQLALMPDDVMRATLGRKIKDSGVLGELPLREIPWMSNNIYDNTVSVLGDLYVNKSGVQVLDPKFLTEVRAGLTSKKIWESPELRQRVMNLTVEQQAQVRMQVGFANQGQFDLLVQGGRIDTTMSRFRIKSISPSGDIYGYNDLPMYGPKEIWNGPDGHMYVGALEDIVNAMRVYAPGVSESSFKKLVVRYGAAEGGKRNISVMLDKASQVRGTQNMVELRQVQGSLQQGFERIMGEYVGDVGEADKKKVASRVNTVVSTLLGSEGRFIDIGTGGGKFASYELVDRNFNSVVTRAIERKQAELLGSGKAVDIGDRQEIWNLARKGAEEMEKSGIREGVIRQLGDNAPNQTALIRIQELIAWASGIN